MRSSDYRRVAPNRKFLKHGGLESEVGTREIFDMLSKEHIIEFTGRPDQWQQYVELSDTGISLPSVRQNIIQPEDFSPEHFELIIPQGARSLSSQLAMIKRDISAYSEVVLVLGEYLAEIHKKTGLLPTPLNDRGVLESIMIHEGLDSDNGVGMLLIPPFYLQKEPTLTNVRNTIKKELSNSEIFTTEELSELLKMLEIGFGEV